jgi:hypothetical protein
MSSRAQDALLALGPYLCRQPTLLAKVRSRCVQRAGSTRWQLRLEPA